MSEQIPLGECPTHGFVKGTDVDYRFPNPAMCQCGEELIRVTITTTEIAGRYIAKNRNRSHR